MAKNCIPIIPPKAKQASISNTALELFEQRNIAIVDHRPQEEITKLTKELKKHVARKKSLCV